MSSTTNILLLAGGIAGGTLLLSKIVKTNSLYKKFEVLPEISVYNIGKDGLVINADAKVVNPSSGSVKLRKPTIKLWNADKTKLLGISDAYAEIQTLPAWNSIWFRNIRIGIPLLSLPTNILTLLKSGYLKLLVETILTVEGVQVSKEDVVELSLTF